MQLLSSLLQSTAMASTVNQDATPSFLLMAAGSLAALAYGGICVGLYFNQRKLIFKPQQLVLRTPADIGLAYEEVWIPVSSQDNAGQTAGHDVGKLNGWWLPNPKSDRTLLFFHGNYGNISHNLERIQFHHSLGFSVLAIDYRGYGKSLGDGPNEQAAYADAEAAWAYLTQNRQIEPETITVFGHSLGGAIAINLALQHPSMARLIVKSSFTCMKDAVHAKKLYRLFPVNLLLTEHFHSLSKVKDLQVPVLYIHGDQDPDIPAHMSQQLYDASYEPKQLWFAPGANHNDISTVQGDSYAAVVQSFCREHQLQPT
ncbi:MAG: alpha/beta hydrolase [Cyanobacteria bacterium P01_A01_bin.116]